MGRMISVDGLVHGLSADYMTGKRLLCSFRKDMRHTSCREAAHSNISELQWSTVREDI